MYAGQSFTKQDLAHWIPRVIVAIILGQTLPFKFMGAEESVWIFTQLNMEPYGRIGIAIIETAVVILILSKFYILGAIIALSIISAANLLHFIKLGLIIQNDGGLLFMLSLVVIVCSLWIVIYWNNVRKKGKKVLFNFDD